MKAKKNTKRNVAGDSSANEINAILATAPKDHRAALEKIRKTVQVAAPEAVEAISYGLPAFKYKGKPLAGYASYKDHCSYFPMSGRVIGTLHSELKAYKTSKGAIHFQPEHPIPTTLLKKLIQARLKEIEET